MLEKPTFPYGLPGHAGQTHCAECDARVFCLAGGVDESCAAALCAIIRKKGPYSADQRIYRRGSAVHHLYSIEKGSVKLETVSRDGRRLVAGFLFPGELLGIDGLGNGSYPADAIALEETYLCALPLKEVQALCRKASGLQSQLFSRLGNALRTARYECSALRQQSATARTFDFLCEVRTRLGLTDSKRACEIPLPMTKQDIASYLGMSPESLSRSLKKLEQDGRIRNNPRSVTLL